MEYISSILSLLFVLGALISIFWGIYIIRLDRNSKINRTFLLICIALSIWSFGFAISNSSTSIEIAVYWRRFASIGMTSIYSIILHFLLLLTRKKKNRELDYTVYFIYIPAIICMYIFSISSSMARIQYDLVRTDYGLTNIASNTVWNYFYYAYYSLYVILILAIIWNWKKRMGDKKKIRQAKLIFVAVLSTSILGSLTDIVSTTFMTKPLPQIAPILILLPVWTMYYSARHYDLIEYEKSFKNELIVTEKEKQKIFYSISMVFIISGIFSFLLEYSLVIKNPGKDFNWGLLRSIIFLINGAIIYLVQQLKNIRLKDNITIAILVLNIPLITLYFINHFSITIWAFPIIIMIASLVFSKKTLLITTAVVSIATQPLIWILKPKGRVFISEYDYILRMILLLIAFIVGYYVNEIYIGKIEENEFQIRFQTLNGKISSDFISINKENKDQRIDMLLSKVGIFFEADRTYLFLIDYEKDTMTYSHEWCNEGIKAEVKTIEGIPLEVFPWWIKELNQKQLVSIEDVNDMPKEAINEQKQLLRQNVKTLISVPVEGKKRMKGFIGVDSVKTFRRWTEQDIKLLNILSNLLSDGLTRVKAEEKIEYMAYYDNLTKLPNRILFKDRSISAINLARRTGNLISIIFIDLDDFKSINDTMGHDCGDHLLKEVAKSLTNRVRNTDTVARFGGDEFMILLNNIKDRNDIEKIAEDIMEIFSKPFNILGEDFFITVSAGISIFPLDGEDPESLIKNADTAMYEAKAKGKNRYEFFSTNLKD